MKNPIALAVTLFCAGQASAQDFEDLDALETRVASHAATAIRPLDRRLKLPRCPDPIQVDAPALGAVAVRCPARGWRMRVAVLGNAAQPAEAQAGPLVIRRGDAVDVTVHGEGFELSFSGVAIDGAPLGHAVRVKTPTAGQPVHAVATGQGTAEMRR
jgi:flagellar basal body P-ring formation protein FlgA